MAKNASGIRGDVRQSALWGSGNRGGELRSNALWGKGGRGIVVTMLLALSMPLAASAGSDPGKGKVGSVSSVTALTAGQPAKGTQVESELLKQAKEKPNGLVRVIVQSDAGVAGAERAAKGLGKLTNRLGLIGAVALELPAKQVERLMQVDGLTITIDGLVRPTSTKYTSTQLWPKESGVDKLWGGPQAPTIAIVDSGIEQGRADFGNRVLADVDFVTTGNTNSPGDGRGHGTFVAGIAAGSASGYAGAAPNAGLVSLDVMDDTGSGRMSDVIAAADWIYQHKAQYNIRVANFSLHTARAGKFHQDPLNRAVEKLWFAGVVVVAAAGNYGKPDGPVWVPYSPGNDPFIITVGAVDIGGTHRLNDDARASWSAYGRTADGFWKPEICASGRFMVGPVPMGSTLAAQRADKIKQQGYMELSGTSFAAPVVAGIAAQLLARNPLLTPDQVKGSLMHRARPVPKSTRGECGVGQVNAVQTATWSKFAANPNKALNSFVKQLDDGSMAFDAIAWTDIAWADATWDTIAWADVAWADVAWADVAWADVAWADLAYEDAAEGDGTTTLDGYVLTPEEEAAAALDPDLLLPGETLPTAEETTGTVVETTDTTVSTTTTTVGSTLP